MSTTRDCEIVRSAGSQPALEVPTVRTVVRQSNPSKTFNGLSRAEPGAPGAMRGRAPTEAGGPS
jgi:hypothetical protein